MKKESLMKILLSPRVSEKSTKLESDRQYVFKAISSATKDDIAQAVKLMFNVSVAKVRVCNVTGKKRKFGKIQGKRQDWKKAYVTLVEGSTINFGGA
jgi:large subunit ribosomal protein L23